MTADRVAAFLLLGFGVLVSIQARALPYWTGNAPGPGFLPLWLGVLLVVASAVMGVRAASKAAADSTEPAAGGRTSPHIVVALTAGFALLTPFTGLIIASGIFMAAMLTYARPGRMRANAIASLVTPLAVWLLFVRWLAVPLPAGPFGF